VIARRRTDSAIAAMGTLNFARDATTGELAARTGLYVVPAYRRLGAGRVLNAWMLTRAKEIGARRAEALILGRNEGSLALFGAMGYRLGPSGIRDRRPPYEEFLLAKRDIE
jgi:GNAT superfamily N-acetyltransferase